MIQRSEAITETAEGEKVWHRERLIFEATERISELMDEQGVNRTTLASRLGTTQGYVTQLLSGQRNMTLRTLSDVFHALGRAANIHDTCLTTELDEPVVLRFRDRPTWGAGYRAEGPTQITLGQATC